MLMYPLYCTIRNKQPGLIDSKSNKMYRPAVLYLFNQQPQPDLLFTLDNELCTMSGMIGNVAYKLLSNLSNQYQLIMSNDLLLYDYGFSTTTQLRHVSHHLAYIVPMRIPTQLLHMNSHGTDKSCMNAIRYWYESMATGTSTIKFDNNNNKYTIILGIWLLHRQQINAYAHELYLTIYTERKLYIVLDINDCLLIDVHVNKSSNNTTNNNYKSMLCCNRTNCQVDIDDIDCSSAHIEPFIIDYNGMEYIVKIKNGVDEFMHSVCCNG